MSKAYKQSEFVYVLLLVTVNSKSGPSVLTKVFCNIVCDSLRPDENEHLRVFLAHLIQMLDQLSALLKVAANFDNLLDVMIRCQLHRADIDLNEVLQEVLKRMNQL